uniref:Secreted protein n=1 Tax=Romanomermis culicivorax TaxID=13658 RepID=A0A915KM12_ROMCU
MQRALVFCAVVTLVFSVILFKAKSSFCWSVSQGNDLSRAAGSWSVKSQSAAAVATSQSIEDWAVVGVGFVRIAPQACPLRNAGAISACRSVEAVSVRLSRLGLVVRALLPVTREVFLGALP